MFFTENKKTSVRFFGNDDASMKAIVKTCNDLSSAYEFKLIEGFVTVAEVFLDTNLAPQERTVQIKKVHDTFKKNLQAFRER